MFCVIADDITGAAEIAGIARRFGCRVRLVIYTPGMSCDRSTDCDIQVYATDSRSMSEAEAIALTTRLGEQLKATGCSMLFKKTDSALRGHIVAELRALLKATGIAQTLLLPQNPSLGRIISDDIYYIKGVPLHETSFALDPEYPATTSCASLLLGLSQSTEDAICLHNATTEEEVAECVREAFCTADCRLFAGAADLFTACLRQEGHQLLPAEPFAGLGARDALIVCGSTVSHPLAGYAYIQQKQLPLSHMPTSVYRGEATAAEWIRAALSLYEQRHSLALLIGHPPLQEKDIALRLRNVMSEVVAALMNRRCPQELIIEGGATAFAILQRMGWNEFEVEQEVAPGVIRLMPVSTPGLHVTMKPGSYDWGTLFA